MSSVDDRIVNMKFNNAQFGKGVNESKRDLTGLEGAIMSAGKGKGMTTLGGAVQKVQAKFSALQVIGVTALATITTKAVSAATRLVKSFTIDPIIAGFKEYQTNLDSIQTIMANTGKSVKVVNKYLDELNHYADQTVYNFSEMARNIGTFTAAGVDLKTATQSIKGIANLAALSGSNSQQASTAMYQLSQAIAAGRVGLQDWNSVVNAGMGGKIFQTALARTATSMGQLSKNSIAMVGPMKQLKIDGASFRESISAVGGPSWLTGDVLVETLKQISGGYSDAQLKAKGFTDQQIRDIQKLARTAFDAATQIKTLPQLLDVIKESMGSTFAQGFRFILGDFEQSKKLWGDVGFFLLGPGGPITKLQNGITNMLDDWSEPGSWGRFKLLEGVKNIFMAMYGLMKTVGKAWRDVFPPATGKTLFEITRSFKRFTENLIPSQKTLKSLRSIFGGFFAILHIGWSIVTGIAGAFGEFFGAFFEGSKGARSGILDVIASVAEVIKSFDEWLTSGNRLTDGIKTFGGVIGAVFYPIVWTIGQIIDAFGALASGEGIDAIAAPIDRISNGFLKFVELVIAGLANVTAPFEKVSGFFSDLQGKISGMSGNFASVLEPLQNLNFSVGGGGAGIFDSIIDGAKKLGDAIVNAFRDIDGTIEKLSDKADGVGDKVSAGVSKIGDAADVVKGKTSGIYDEIAGAGAEAASASMGKVGDAAGSVGDIFDSIGGIIKTAAEGLADALGWMVEKLSNIPFPGDALEWATLLNALISGALIKRLFFSKGVLGQLKDTIADVGESLTDTFGMMQKQIKSEIIRNIAISIGILAASLLILSMIPAKKLGQGLGALAALFAILSGSMFILMKTLDADTFSDGKLTSKAASIIALGGAMLLMATAVAIMAAAVAALAFIPLKQLATGMGAVILLITVMVASMQALSGIDKEVAAVGAAMVLMATAIDMLVFAVLALAFIPLKNLATGMGFVAIGLGLMVGGLVLLSKFAPDVFKSAAAMVLVAASINMLVTAVLALAFIPLKNLAIGMGAVAVGLGLMVGSLVLLSMFAPGALAAGAAMLLLSTSLLAMATVITMLGVLPWEVLVRGIVGMAAGLAVLVAAAYLAMPVIPGLIALSVIIKAIGIALLATGAGFLMFATGLALIAALGTAAIAVITLAIGAFIALLPNIAIQMAAAFVAFLQAIALAAPKIRKAMNIIFKNMLKAAEDNLPRLAKLIQEGLTFLIQVITAMFPAMYEAAWRLLEGLLKSIEDHLPNVIDSAYAIAYAIIDGMGDRAVDLANAGADALIEMLNGLAKAVETKGPKIREAMGNLADALGHELKEALKSVLGAINPMDYLTKFNPGALAGTLGSKVGDGLGNLFKMGANSNGPRRNAYSDILNQRKAQPEENPLEGFSAAIQSAATTIVNSVKSFVTQMGNFTSVIGMSAGQMQLAATYQSTVAESRGSAADAAVENADTFYGNANSRLDNAKNMKKSNPKRAKAIKDAKKQVAKAEAARKAARKQREAADAAAAKAELTQMKADYARQKDLDAAQFKDDPAALGDSKQQISEDLANQSAQLAAQAQARADEAARLDAMAKKDKKNSKKYHDQARELRKQAAAETAQSLLLSAQSIEAQAAAAAAYAEARKRAALDAIAQMAEIRKQQQAEAAARAWQDQYNAADDETKKKMLAARQAENEKIAANAEAALNMQLFIGDSIAAKIALTGAASEEDLAAANAAAEEAARQAQIAAEARDKAQQDADALKQLNEQAATSNTTTGGSSVATPSKSVLEDAANAVDRYTASVAQAEEAAAAGASTTQFVQNNYSPEALSNADIYRRTYNLVSAAQTKLDDAKGSGVRFTPPSQT